MQFLKIETERTGYSPKQVEESNGYGKALTVGELKALLEDYDDDLPIYLSNDNGYTYGAIRADNVAEADYEDE